MTNVATNTAAKTNTYDNLLVILISSLVFGYFGGWEVSPVHIVEIFVLPYLLSSKGLFRKKVFSRLFLFSFVWMSFCVLSLLWTSSLDRGIVSVIMYLFRVLMCFELLAFSIKARRPLASISKGWMLAVALTSIIALWEIFTDHHLGIAREVDLGPLNTLVQRTQASVLFYNPNTYSLFLVMAFPFLAYRLVSENRKRLTIAVMLVLLYVVIRNASRGAILCLGVMTVMTLFFFIKRRKYRGYAILSLLFLAAILAIFGSSLFSSFILRMEAQGLQDGARFEIWAGAWQVFVKSHGLGTGAGSMLDEVGSMNHLGIAYTHCMLLEALVEGGVFLASLIIFVLIRLFKAAVSESQKDVRLVLWMSMITYPIYFIINSEYLRPAFIWCFFMCVYLFAMHRKLQVSHPTRRDPAVSPIAA